MRVFILLVFVSLWMHPAVLFSFQSKHTVENRSRAVAYARDGGSPVDSTRLKEIESWYSRVRKELLADKQNDTELVRNHLRKLGNQIEYFRLQEQGAFSPPTPATARHANRVLWRGLDMSAEGGWPWHYPRENRRAVQDYVQISNDCVPRPNGRVIAIGPSESFKEFRECTPYLMDGDTVFFRDGRHRINLSDIDSHTFLTDINFVGESRKNTILEKVYHFVFYTGIHPQATNTPFGTRFF